MKKDKSSFYSNRLNAFLGKFLGYYLLALVIFTANRLALLFRFKPAGLFEDYKADIPKVFLTGFRFDTQIILYAGLPLLLAALILAAFKNGNKIFNRFFVIYGSVITALMAALLLFDQGYYSFFKSHYDTIVFGIIQDDTNAVLHSIWTDHPVIRVLLVLTCVVFVIVLVSKKIARRRTGLLQGAPLWLQLVIPFIFMGLVFVGLRGSLSTFPLGNDDTTVSGSMFLNFLTPNAIFCLNEAAIDKEKTFHDFNNEKLVQQFGYTDEKQAYLSYFGKQVSGDSLSLFATTPSDSFLERHPPNVVFVQMESFSNYYLDFNDEQKFDLLGRLALHFKQDLLFRNFVSGENGTIPTLENLMVNIPYHPVAQTAYKKVSFPTSVAFPYKHAGYETIFVTGGKLGWRNLGSFVPQQGFDKVYGQAAIAHALQYTESNIWGVYDEYLFRFVQKLLEENDGKPKFIFVMTTSNHSPYSRPEHYQAYPLTITDSIRQLTANNPQTLNNFLNYQYSADCLGGFLDTLKASTLKDNTIIAATGDHNTLMLFQFDESLMQMKRGVPFYLYAPQAYLKGKITNTKRFGSHKDIFPTLFNLSLSGQRYFNMGNDLLSADSSILFFGENEHQMAIAQSGAVVDFPGRNVRYFKWENDDRSRLKEVGKSEAAGDTLLLQKATSRTFLLRYYFNQFLQSR